MIQVQSRMKRPIATHRTSLTFHRTILRLLTISFSVVLLSCAPSDEERREQRRLVDLIVETREVELEALTRKVDPESLGLANRIKSLERSIHDLHEEFESLTGPYEQHIGDLEKEIADLRLRIDALQPGTPGRFVTTDEAWERYWLVTRELERVRTRPWRNR